MKPGYKTTEFWTAVVVILASGIDSLGGSLPDRYGATAASIAAGLYAISRGLAKLHQPPAP